MSFFERIGEGLAFAHREAAKHITAENINRGAQEAWKAVDYAAQQAQQVRLMKKLSVLSIRSQADQLALACHC